MTAISALISLREILDLDCVAEAAPDVLSGADVLDRPVRWVHSSEIYEIGPLLSGGELLLTTGLGLATADAGARRHWVRELAAREIAGVAFEVGRSLPDIPPEVVEESRKHGLPLVALRKVVPFVRITEAANTAIIAHGMAARAARERRDGPPERSAYAAGLLADLAEGRAVNQPEVSARSALAGFLPSASQRLLGLSAHGAAPALLDSAARALGGHVLRAAFPGDTLALFALPGSVRDPVRALQEALRATATTGLATTGLTAAVGHAVPADGPWTDWSDTLRAARTALELALTVPSAEPGRPGPVVTSSRALALERELTRGGVEPNRPRLARLVSHTLAPLLDWESAHGSDLVRTLEVHLRHGCSPTRTAALLHVGRQSLYQRLERIELLLGAPVTDPELHSELLVAACAHRILRGAQARPGALAA
jgi:hypothetical protein